MSPACAPSQREQFAQKASQVDAACVSQAERRGSESPLSAKGRVSLLLLALGPFLQTGCIFSFELTKPTSLRKGCYRKGITYSCVLPGRENRLSVVIMVSSLSKQPPASAALLRECPASII